MPYDLKKILADQAKLYGQVHNVSWFASRIASHRAAGEHATAEAVIEIAKRHDIELPCDTRAAAPIRMTLRQAS